MDPPFGVFLHVPKVPSNEPTVCAPRRPGGFKVFFEAGLQLPLPPKKKCDRTYACETLERLFGACAKRDGRTGLSRTILQDGVLCKVNVKLTSPLRKNIQVFSP